MGMSKWPCGWHILGGVIAGWASVLALFLLFSMTGCAKADAVTPRYGIQVTTDVPVDLDALDTAWEQASECWQHELGRHFTVSPPGVHIVSKGLRTGGRACAYFISGYGWVAGMTGGREVWLAPDLCAARHEFAHWIEKAATGHTDAVLTKCDEGGGW